MAKIKDLQPTVPVVPGKHTYSVWSGSEERTVAEGSADTLDEIYLEIGPWISTAGTVTTITGA